jgi:hypothetical protein
MTLVYWNNCTLEVMEETLLFVILKKTIYKTENMRHLETETDETQGTFCDNMKATVFSNKVLELACQGNMVPDVLLQALDPIGP